MDEKDEIVISIDLIEEAIAYCDSISFQSRLEDFENKHEHLFEYMHESKRPDDCLEDIPIECSQVFSEYQELIEGMFSNFANKHNCSSLDFFENCMSVYEGRFLPLFEEEHKNKWFVDLLLSWT